MQTTATSISSRTGTTLTPGSLSKPASIVSWIAQVIAAVILAQTLFFKFTGAPESIHIFKTMGMESWGRYGSGIAELIAVILLLLPVPRLNAIGAGLGAGVIVGAIGSHLTNLGIAIPNLDAQGNKIAGDDGGLLFGLACVVLVACGVVVFLRRKGIPIVGQKL